MGDLLEMKVPALTGHNFVVWKDRLELFLDAHDLLGVVSEELDEGATTSQKNAWKKADKKAKYYIASAVPDAFYNVVEGKRTSKAMMDAVEAQFAVKSVSQQTHFKRELLNLKYDEGADLSAHLMKFEALIRKLEGSGALVKAQDKLSYLFVTLPPKYDAVTSILENIPDITFDEAKGKLLSEEIKQKGREVYDVGGSSVVYRTRYQRRPLVCFACGEEGHKSFECPERKKYAKVANVEANGVAMTAVRENFVTNSVAMENVVDMNEAAIVAEKHSEKVVWTLDSGASNHMVNDMRFLDSVTDCCSEIELAGEGISVVSEKQGHLKCTNDDDVKLYIKDVLYVPNMRQNLLSVKKLTSKGICVSFEGNAAVMKKDGKVIGVANLNGNLYKFVVKVKYKKPLMSNVNSEEGHEASGGKQINNRLILHEPRVSKCFKFYKDHSVTIYERIPKLSGSIGMNRSSLGGCYAKQYKKDV